MTQFATSWRLSRGRFVAEVQDLSQAQLNWRLYPGSLSIGEMALHVAGVEVSFTSQLTDAPLDEFKSRLKQAATEGVVNDLPFPFSAEEITPSLVKETLAIAESMAGPLIENPSSDALSREIVSALGPVITGEGALARFAFHPAYHQGQAYQMKNAPGFPT
jgi:hypothetical protein